MKLGELRFNDTNQQDVWHKKVLSYEPLVERWTRYFWNINKSFLYSYEDLRQTVWYILMIGLKTYDGRGTERDYLNWFVRNKMISIMVYGKKPPDCKDAPFTPLRFDYVSPDDLTEVNELFYSECDL